LTKGVLFAPKGVLFAPSDIDVTGDVRKSRGSIGGKTIINPQEETMKTHVLLALVGLATGFITPAFTQTTIPKELVGTWTMVSITQEQDGKQTDLFGPNPQGRRIIDADGHVFYIATRGDLPKFASNNRAAGTPSLAVRTWTMVSITQEQDGKQTDLFGPNPQGGLIRDTDGHV